MQPVRVLPSGRQSTSRRRDSAGDRHDEAVVVDGSRFDAMQLMAQRQGVVTQMGNQGHAGEGQRHDGPAPFGDFRCREDQSSCVDRVGGRDGALSAVVVTIRRYASVLDLAARLDLGCDPLHIVEDAQQVAVAIVSIGGGFDPVSYGVTVSVVSRVDLANPAG